MGKIWILTYEIDREGGSVMGAYSTKQKAMTEGQAASDKDENQWNTIDLHEIKIDAPADYWMGRNPIHTFKSSRSGK